MGEESGTKAGHAGPWLGCVGGDRGALRENNACDVGADDGGVGGDERTHVAHVVVNGIEGGGFDLDE